MLSLYIFQLTSPRLFFPTLSRTDVKLYQESGICIGSGAVESTIKRLSARVKISGAQWKVENVPQLLKLRCAYVNQAIA